MKWEVSTPPASQPITFTEVMTHLKLHNYDEKDYIEDTIEDAVAYAENEMECSLVSQTITATHYEDGEKFFLPRGPVLSITSVTADGTAVSSDLYELKRIGNHDYLECSSGLVAPVVIVYAAGYTSGNVPKDIRRALLMHVGSLYEQREGHRERQSYDVENGLKRVYERHRRTPLVG